MIASIDSNFCTGCEECVISCPDIFELNLTTYLAAVKVSPVPADLEGSVKSVASECPVSAIKITA